MYLRWPSAKMVSNARLLLPLPDTPVNTTSRSRGIASPMPFRLCSRAPSTRIWRSWLGWEGGAGHLYRSGDRIRGPVGAEVGSGKIGRSPIPASRLAETCIRCRLPINPSERDDGKTVFPNQPGYCPTTPMSLENGNLAIAEPPVRPSIPMRDRATEREPAHASDLAMLRERAKRMRMPRGEFLPTSER